MDAIVSALYLSNVLVHVLLVTNSCLYSCTVRPLFLFYLIVRLRFIFCKAFFYFASEMFTLELLVCSFWGGALTGGVCLFWLISNNSVQL